MGEHMGGVFNIVFGLAMLAAGLSGKFSLFGTDSSTALAVAGGVVAIVGIYQSLKKRSRRDDFD